MCYTCDKADGRDGFIVEIVRAALKHSGVSVQYHVVPWTRAIEEVRAGKYQALIGASKGDAPDFMFTKEPQAMMSNRAWVKKSDPWRYHGVESLKGRKLGVIADYFYGDDIMEYISKNTADKVGVQVLGGDNALALNVRKLKAGRVDVVIEDVNVMREYLVGAKDVDALDDAGEVTPEAKKLEVNGLYAAFSPKDPRSGTLVKQLESGMAKILASGEFAEILKRYNVVERKN